MAALCPGLLLIAISLLGGCRTASRAPARPQLPSGLLVHDPDTGRTWTPPSPQILGWDVAGTYCAQLPPSGQWRLPYRNEIEAQFDGESLRPPFLPVPDGVLFTGELVPGRGSDHIWVANPTNGHVFNGQGREGYARCIRALDPYAEQQLADEAQNRWTAGTDQADTSALATEDAHILGSTGAPITLWYFFDFTCPYCSRAHDTMRQLVEQDPRVRVVYKAAPILSFHPHGEEAHAAAYAAGQQGRYFEMTELLFAEIRLFQIEPDMVALDFAAELDLDLGRFETDYHSPETAARIRRELEQAQGMGINGLPTTFVEDRKVSGARPLEDFQAAVDGAAK